MCKTREGAQPFCHWAGFVSSKHRELARYAQGNDTRRRDLPGVVDVGISKQDGRVNTEPRIPHPAAEARECRRKAVNLMYHNDRRSCRPCQQDRFGVAQQIEVASGEISDGRNEFQACDPSVFLLNIFRRNYFVKNSERKIPPGRIPSVADVSSGSKPKKLNESKCFSLFTQTNIAKLFQAQRRPARLRMTDALTEQRYKHLYLISCCNDQCVVVGLPLSCRFQNTLGKICLRCRGRMFQGHSSHNVLKNLLHEAFVLFNRHRLSFSERAQQKLNENEAIHFDLTFDSWDPHFYNLLPICRF